MSSIGTKVELELAYDGSGRPVEATAEFSPICDAGPGGSEPTDPACWTYESQTQRWTWDSEGRLARVERDVGVGVEPSAADPAADPAMSVAEEFRCFVSAEQVVVETMTWTYDDSGRLKTSVTTFRDCTDAETRTESLIYGASEVEARVEVTDGSGSSVQSRRYQIDECGRVISSEIGSPEPAAPFQYQYDEHGRLTFAADTTGERRWSYDAGIVASRPDLGVEWTLEASRDSRTLWLIQERPNDFRYEIRLDERRRVVAVESDGELWTLTYDDCPNAELAQTQWRVGETLGTWSFPAPVEPGEGYTALEQWTFAMLPLQPTVW